MLWAGGLYHEINLNILVSVFPTAIESKMIFHFKFYLKAAFDQQLQTIFVLISVHTPISAHSDLIFEIHVSWMQIRLISIDTLQYKMHISTPYSIHLQNQRKQV